MYVIYKYVKNVAAQTTRLRFIIPTIRDRFYSISDEKFVSSSTVDLQTTIDK